MKFTATLLLSFIMITFLSAFTGCSSTGDKLSPLEQASEVVTLYALIKHYDRDAITAKDLMKGYPDAKPEVNVWLEDMLGVKSLLKNPKIDILDKLAMKRKSYEKLKNHVRLNWDKIKDEDQPFVSAFEDKMDSLFQLLAATDATINKSEKAKLIMDYLSTVNQLNTAISGKLL